MGIFSAIFKALTIARIQKETLAAKEKITEEMDFCNHPNLLKRSELTDEDIEMLRKRTEEDEILATAQNVQELKYYIAYNAETSPREVELFNDGKVFVENRERWKWRYNEFGILEYYIPGSKPTIETQTYQEEEEDFLYDFDEYIQDDINYPLN